MWENIGKKCLSHELLESEDSRDGAPLDEVNRFLRAKSSSGRMVDPLNWWKENAGRYPAVAKVSKNLLGNQASSAARRSTFSVVES